MNETFYGVRLLHEGMPSLDGRVVVPGTTTWEDIIPAVAMDDGDSLLRIVGMVQNIQRQTPDDEPWLVGDLTLFDEAEGNVCQAEMIVHGNVDTLAMVGQLRAVKIGDSPAWDGMEFR